MTKAEIENKKPVWPWIAGLLVFGAIIYFLFFRENNAANTANLPDTNTETRREINAGSEVTGYFQLIDNDTDTMDLSHDFTNESLTGLIAATRATAQEHEVDVHADLELAEQIATEISQEPFDTSDANKVRSAAVHLTAALVKIQEAEFRNLSGEASSLKAATLAIQEDILVREQKMEVKNFFRMAKDLLEKMYM